MGEKELVDRKGLFEEGFNIKGRDFTEFGP